MKASHAEISNQGCRCTGGMGEAWYELKVVRTHPLAEVIWRIHGAFRSVFRSFSPSVTQLTC